MNHHNGHKGHKTATLEIFVSLVSFVLISASSQRAASIQDSDRTVADHVYSDAQAAALASVLIPDVLVYSRSSTLPAPLNGRALADDVIDVELNVTTGGDPLDLFANRNATGAVPGDGVGPHTDYLAHFPYLGKPH